MRPQDIEKYTALRIAKAEADQAVEDFNHRDIDLVPGAENKMAEERLEDLWSALMEIIDSDPASIRFSGDEYSALTGMRFVVVDEGANTYYKLTFFLKRDSFEQRRIEATWTRMVGQTTDLQHTEVILESISGKFPKGHLQELANMEWTLLAYQEAEAPVHRP